MSLRVRKTRSHGVVRLVVDSASYGKNVNGVGSDRTSYFANSVKGASLAFTFYYASMGGDPFPNIVKNMVVNYHCELFDADGNVTLKRGTAHNWTSPAGKEAGVNTPINVQCGDEFKGVGPSHRNKCGRVISDVKRVGRRLVIDSASYGKNVNGVGSDRTSFFANAVKGDSLAFTFYYASMGGDPFPNIVKNMVINYHCEIFNYDENRTIKRGSGQIWASPAGREAGINTPTNIQCTENDTSDTSSFRVKLVVDSASYGKNVNGVGSDRTSYFANAVKGNSLAFTFYYASMGGDPFPGIVKNMMVAYHCELFDDRTSRTVKRGSGQIWASPAGREAGINTPINVSCPQDFVQIKPAVRLVIDSARYGKNVNGVGSDRTSYFANAVKGDSLNHTFYYITMGGDPFPGIVKNMVITYHCEDGNSRGPAKTYTSPAGTEAGFNLRVSIQCN